MSTLDALMDALHNFVGVVNAAGGVTRKNGLPELVGDKGWNDLASAYIEACDAISAPYEGGYEEEEEED